MFLARRQVQVSLKVFEVMVSVTVRPVSLSATDGLVFQGLRRQANLMAAVFWKNWNWSIFRPVRRDHALDHVGREVHRYAAEAILVARG